MNKTITVCDKAGQKVFEFNNAGAMAKIEPKDGGTFVVMDGVDVVFIGSTAEHIAYVTVDNRETEREHETVNIVNIANDSGVWEYLGSKQGFERMIAIINGKKLSPS